VSGVSQTSFQACVPTLSCFVCFPFRSLFVLGSHTKKRPNNIVVGRTFNHQILDMIELGVIAMRPMEDFKVSYIFDWLESQENHLLIFGLLRFSFFFFRLKRVPLDRSTVSCLTGRSLIRRRSSRCSRATFLVPCLSPPLVSRATS